MHGLDVEAHDVGLALEVRLEEAAEVAEAGVVADADDLALAGQQLARRACCAAAASPRSQVSTSTWTSWASRSSSASSSRRSRAACDQRDVVAALGELAREVGADAGGRAGDQDGRAVRGGGRAMPAFLPCGALDSRSLRASRSPRATASRSPSTRCCAAGSSSSASRRRTRSTRPSRSPWALLERVHDGELLRRIRDGELSVREQRGLGLPWSPELVERGRRSVAGTLARGAPRARPRRRDEPRRRHPPRRAGVRPRLLPVQRRRVRARPAARGRASPSTRSWSTATSTRATAPPTCSAPTRTRSRCRCTARATTRSSASPPTSTSTCRPARATPTTSGRSTTRSTRRWTAARPTSRSTSRGADPWEGDRLGRLSLTKAGLRARDALVLDRLRAAGADVCVVLAGGYAEDVRDTVEINAGTAAAVAARLDPIPDLSSRPAAARRQRMTR